MKLIIASNCVSIMKVLSAVAVTMAIDSIQMDTRAQVMQH